MLVHILLGEAISLTQDNKRIGSQCQRGIPAYSQRVWYIHVLGWLRSMGRRSERRVAKRVLFPSIKSHGYRKGDRGAAGIANMYTNSQERATAVR